MTLLDRKSTPLHSDNGEVQKGRDGVEEKESAAVPDSSYVPQTPAALSRRQRGSLFKAQERFRRRLQRAQFLFPRVSNGGVIRLSPSPPSLFFPSDVSPLSRE